ncbi:ranBP-type and C3HC4-type zinc finger-containing protein 1 [Amia ocellicauda]|uniref:ranBP-type and C3HC4-type zinc finger-containing protein 1 n=1 Tax=Amia ocellicauda TaxID=2972642 RepID=UPI00346498FD|nr:HOIL1 protein [Amia calva]
MATPDPSGLKTLEEAEELAQCLSVALSGGDQEEAQRCARELARQQLPVSVRICPEAYPEGEIRFKVGVEDAQSESSIPIAIIVTSDMTVANLKEKVNRDYGFHPSLQTWVIGKRLAKDADTLYSHGVRKDGDPGFLYIKSAQQAQLTREQLQHDQEERRLYDILSLLEPRGIVDPSCLNKKKEELLRRPKNPPPPLPPKHVLPMPPPPPPKPKLGWDCPECTFHNKPTRPGCEMCSAARPAAYQVPPIYQPDEDEARWLQQEQAACLQFQQALEKERTTNFQELLQTDQHSLVANSQLLDCPICFGRIEPGEGATLRECLHSFCKECLKGTITNSMDAEVACPYSDEDYACNSKLQDREIRTLLSEDEYQRFLELRLSIAENRSANSYHCKTPDCAGWCIFEDEVNEFLCPLCQKTNCLLCKAIHEGMNCKEYQDDLRIRAENDVAAKQTTDMLKEMVAKGEAMYCPQCQVIVQKKDGCDWICCLMCKTEICWVTRGPRWGPKGRGDTSGGCGCRLNVAPCHPNCQNCH